MLLCAMVQARDKVRIVNRKVGEARAAFLLARDQLKQSVDHHQKHKAQRKECSLTTE